MRNFKNYDIWTDGVDFCVEVYKMTEQSQKKKKINE